MPNNHEIFKNLRFTVDSEDDVYVARVAESSLLAAHGDTPSKALAELEQVVAWEAQALSKAVAPVMIILVNADAKMGKGKIAGQVGHVVARYERDLTHRDARLYTLWLANNETKIVKKATEDLLVRAHSMFMLQGAKDVRDAGRTQVEPNTLTAVALPPMPQSQLPDWIIELKLL